VGHGVAAPKPITFPDAPGAELPEGHNSLSVLMGEERNVSGGVFDHGTPEEDGPVTAHVRVCGGAGWETAGSTRKGFSISSSTNLGDTYHDLVSFVIGHCISKALIPFLINKD
jgi:hypothetical protein